MVLVRQAPPTAKGMVFFTLEDANGFFNLVFRPDVFQQYSDFLHEQCFLCVEGILQTSNTNPSQTASYGASSILVHKVFRETAGQAEVISIQKDGKSKLPPQSGHASKHKLLSALSEFRNARNYH
jgi:DNA polymerase III alpha subunit